MTSQLHLDPAPSRSWRSDYPLLLLLVVLHFVVRWFILRTPMLSQLFYDEAITGLMGMAAQHGQVQAFWWGQAYMGTLEACSASLLFHLLGPSTLAMRLTLVFWSTLALVALYGFGRQAGGRWAGFWAAAWWALAPIAGSFAGLIALGGHSESLALGAAALWGCSTLAFGRPRRPLLVAVLTGLAGGLAFWSSLLAAPLLLAGALCILVARPRLLLEGTAWLGLAGFLLGSAPFWWWNLGHQWLTLVHFHSGHQNLVENFRHLLQKVWTPVLVGRWWDGRSVEGMIAPPLRWGVLLVFYLPALALLLWRSGLWLRRLWRRQRPWQQPLDLACLALWLAMTAHAASQFGHSGVTRYAALLFIPLAVMVGYWLARLQGRLPALGVALACALLAFNAYTQVLFLQKDAMGPRREVDRVIRKLDELGFRYCYGDARIAYPIWFESGGRIVASNFRGWHNYAPLLQVNAAAKVALVARAGFGVSPRIWRQALTVLGTPFQEVRAGSYHVFYGFRPAPALRPLDKRGWRIQASVKGDPAAELLDRDPLTSWSSGGVAGASLELDLGRVATVARVTLLPTVQERGARRTLTLGLWLSSDGVTWRAVVERGTALTGLLWYGAHPRMSGVPAVQLTFSPQPARYLRIVLDPGAKRPPERRFSELFVDGPGSVTGAAPLSARESYRQARQELYRYYSDPTGPQPGVFHLPLTVRNHKVAWLYVFAKLREAMNAAPDWERPYLLFLEALGLGDMRGRLLAPAWDGLLLVKGETVPFLRGAGEGRAKGLLVSGAGRFSYRGWGLAGKGTVRLGEPLRLTPPPPAGDGAQKRELLVRCLAGKLLVRPLPGYTVLKRQCWTVRRQAEDTPFKVGAPAAEPRARGGQCLRAEPGRDQPALMRVYLRPYFAKGSYHAYFRLRGARTDKGPLAELDVLRHAGGRVLGTLARRSWAGTAGGQDFQYVFLSFDNDREPVKLELRLRYLGKGPLWIDELGVLPACASGPPPGGN